MSQYAIQTGGWYSPRRYRSKEAAVRAARHIAGAAIRDCTVLWCDDTGKPKVVVARVHAGGIVGQPRTRVEWADRP